MTSSRDMLFSGSVDGVMSGTNKISSAWISLGKEDSSVSIGALWDGDPLGTFDLEAKIADKRTVDFDLDEGSIDQPDGTTYAGDLTEADLDAEDLGEALIKMRNIGCDWVRLSYTNVSGSGTLNAVISFKSGSGNQLLAMKNDSLIDGTDESAATHYYPTRGWLSMDGYNHLSLTGKLIDADGTLTMTVEATNDEDTVNADWVQVHGYDDINDIIVNSWAVTNGTLLFAFSFNVANFRYFRVKLIASGATNTVIIKARRRV